tara:strand:- start:1620 stop:1895 length:276 start_codon:yes stop_codon:yes gene_type:complete
MEKFFKWLVLSSDNPKEVALTIKGITMMFIPSLIGFLGDLGLNIAQSDVVFYITLATSSIGAALTLVGLVRKLINTFGEKEIVAFKAKKKK